VDLFFPEARKTVEPVPAVETDMSVLDDAPARRSGRKAEAPAAVEADAEDASDLVKSSTAKSSVKSVSKDADAAKSAGAGKSMGSAGSATKSEPVGPDASAGVESDDVETPRAAGTARKADSGAVRDIDVELVEKTYRAMIDAFITLELEVYKAGS